MFPIPFNFPFRKKDGSITSIGDAMGGGSYTLPTASAETKGGVKIGSGLTMTGEVLSATGGLPSHNIDDAGKVLTVDSDGSLIWDDVEGLQTMTADEWDALTTEQKKTYGVVGIIENTTGYERGVIVNGADYLPINGVRVYTKSTSGTDPIMTVQAINYNTSTGTYENVGTPVDVHAVDTPSYISLFGIIRIQYYNNWSIMSIVALKDTNNVSYAADTVVKTWAFTSSIDEVYYEE